MPIQSVPVRGGLNAWALVLPLAALSRVAQPNVLTRYTSPHPTLLNTPGKGETEGHRDSRN